VAFSFPGGAARPLPPVSYTTAYTTRLTCRLRWSIGFGHTTDK